MKQSLISIIFLLNFFFVYKCDAIAENPSNNTTVTDGTVTTESPFTFEYIKKQGETMTLDQLIDLKTKILELIDKYPSGSEDDYRLLHHSSSILAIGLYKKDVKYAQEVINEVKSNLLSFYQKRGDKKWNRDDMEDQLLVEKFSLFLKLLENLLFVSYKEGNYDFSLNLMKENMDMPFVVARSMIIKYLVRLYNTENLSPEIKMKSETIFNHLIEIEKDSLENNKEQEDFIRSRSSSSALLKVLIDKKDNGGGGFWSE